MSKKTIAIMCGHGKSMDKSWDSGCTYKYNGKTYTEAQLMLPITKAAVKYLRNQPGLTVISDADQNNNKNMIADVKWANNENAALYVSIHCDYYKSPSGVMPLYVSSKGNKLADYICKQVNTDLKLKIRGIVKRKDLYELNKTNCPAVVLETGSIKKDLSLLINKPDTYGKAIAKGICKYLGIAFKTPTTKVATVEKKVSANTTKDSNPVSVGTAVSKTSK